MGRKGILLWVGLFSSFLVLQGCAGRSTNNPIKVSPKLAEVAAGAQAQQFTASVSGDGWNAGVSWSVDGIPGGSTTVGTIMPSGNYFAPTTAGYHTITARSVADPAKSAEATIAVTDLAGVFTYHNNRQRDGTNTQEYALNSSTVTPATFGKLFSCQVDGAVYTQPLWVPGVRVNGFLHNVIYVATQHDSVYAFDADASPCVQLWQVTLLDPQHGATVGETPVPCMNDGCDVGTGAGSIQPEIGVTGTPVIDPATGTIYLVSKSENIATQSFHQRLHALDLATGMEKLQFNSPVDVVASVVGNGEGSVGGLVNFDPRMHLQRPGLALSSGTVFVAWGSHEDEEPYHGWVLAYQASNLLLQQGVYNTTPNGGLGGIWCGGGAPAIDADGTLYVSTGNGVFDANVSSVPNNDYGDSILRLDPSSALSMLDWFTPDDESDLADRDADLGSGGVVLLPDQVAGSTHLLVEGGKEGVVYVIDRDNMGHYQVEDNSQVVQTFPASRMFGTPSYWNNGLYFAGGGSSLSLFKFDPSSGLFNPAMASQSIQIFHGPGASPSISSLGNTNGIVWALDASAYGPPRAESGPAILHAYSADDLTVEYWHSQLAANNRDHAGNAVKFVPPTVANGKVYVSTRTEITVYGLLPN